MEYFKMVALRAYYNNDLTKSIVLTEQLLACAETTLAIIALRYNKKQGGGNYD